MGSPRNIVAVPRWMPLGLAGALGAAQGWLAYRADGTARRRAIASQQQAFAELDVAQCQRLCSDAFVAAGRSAWQLGVVRRWSAQRLCRDLTLQDWPRLVEADERGQGVVIVAPPLAGWPLVPLTVGLYRGSVAIVGQRDRDSCLQAWADRLVPEALSWFDDASRVQSILSRGGRVVTPLLPAVNEADVVELPFLGGQVRVSSVTARCACEAGAPLVPVFTQPDIGKATRIMVKEPIESRGQTPEEVMRQTLSVIEQEIRRRSRMWPWWIDQDL